uniref:Uncharacterized protein n=1 Tax=Trichuris muris TaxID=70415 RepID=A0A5S6QI49_TRIMR
MRVTTFWLFSIVLCTLACGTARRKVLKVQKRKYQTPLLSMGTYRELESDGDFANASAEDSEGSSGSSGGSTEEEQRESETINARQQVPENKQENQKRAGHSVRENNSRVRLAQRRHKLRDLQSGRSKW